MSACSVFFNRSLLILYYVLCLYFVFLLLPTWRINPLIPTLKPQSNGPLYSNTVIGTLVVIRCAIRLRRFDL